MRKILIGVGVFIIVLIVAALIAPSLVPSSVYKDKIQTTLTAELGREVNIEGDIRLSVFPLIKAKAGRVTIANADGFDAEYFAAMDGLEARVKLLPLLSKRVEISSFALIAPQIHLEKKLDGQVNWALGDPDEAPEPENAPKKDTGPFKRDGRYQGLDPQIGKFSLNNGLITFDNAAAGQHHELKNANLAFSMPSLAKPVSIKGDVIVNDDPLDLSLSMDSPRKFLDGKDAASSFTVKTGYAQLKGKGSFTAGPDITFIFDLDGNVSDLGQLGDYLPKDYPVDQIIKTAKISGKYGYDGVVLTAENADISAKGPLIDASYKGSAKLSDQPVLDGAVKTHLPNVPKLAGLLGQDIDGIDLVKTLDLSANMKAQDQGFSAQNIKAAVTGDGLAATLDGQGDYDGTPNFSGRITADVSNPAAKAASMGQSIDGLEKIQNVKLAGHVTVAGEAYAARDLIADITGDGLKAGYKGAASYKDGKPAANGTFSAEAASIPALVSALALDNAEVTKLAGALGRAFVDGKVEMQGNDLQITLNDARTDGGALNASYNGAAAIKGERVTLSGNFNATIPSLPVLASAAQTEIPYASSIGRIAAKGQISGAADNLKLSALTASLTDGDLNGKFEGEAVMAEAFNVTGHLQTDIPDLRKLAEATGAQLPPDTASGAIFKAASLSGQVSGNPAQIVFSDAKLNIDDITGSGKVQVDMRGAKPKMSGQLALSQLDLRPYMDSYTSISTNEGVQPWSTEPYNFEALNTLDADLQISTGEILTSNMKIGQSELTAVLSGGVLNAVIPQLNMYGGLGKMTAGIDASGAVPAMHMKVGLDDLSTNNFLTALSGISRLSGEGFTVFDIKGTGRSQAEIMNSLNGLGDFEVKNGVIAGIDIGQFMTGLDQAISSKAMPSGIGTNYSTKFNDLIAKFKIENGIVKIDDFDLEAYGVAASGGGNINLGRQTVDFKLHPHAVGASAGNLAKFGVPLSLSGSFGSVKAGVDTQFLGKIAQQMAAQAAADAIADNLGGPLGDIAGSVITGGLGGGSSSGSGSSGGASGQDIVGGVIGGILGGGASGSQSDTQARTDQSTAQPGGETTSSNIASDNAADADKSLEDQAKDAAEDAIGDALSGLFGGKKKKKN